MFPTVERSLSDETSTTMTSTTSEDSSGTAGAQNDTTEEELDVIRVASLGADNDDDGGDDDKRKGSSSLVAPHGLAARSPMAASLSAKKRRALIALAIPFVFAIVFGLVNNDLPLPLPDGQAVVKRAFDVNAPPVELPEGETLEHIMQMKYNQQHQNHHHYQPSSSKSNPFAVNAPSASRSASLKIEDRPIPVVVDRGEKIPAGVGGKRLKAAEALMCRENVINYVINATNGKDECNGLQKAFDETCSHDEDQDNEMHQEEEETDHRNEDIWLGQRHQRRLLTRQRQWKRRNVLKPSQDIDSLESFLQEARRYTRVILEWLHWSYQPKFYAEDAVFDAFPNAWHHIKHRQKRRRRLEQELLHPPTNYSTFANHSVTKPKTTKPHNYLSLPTGKQHLSEKTLEETLLLQHEDKVMSNLKQAANQTNATTPMNAAQKDAEASSNALSETQEIVSTILNDPSSIEARACCASILNVYHENCNIDAEEEISDKRLFIVVLIMAFCGLVKSLIRHFKIRWLPEAAGCILVGVMSGYVSSYFPHQDFSFDGNWFLRILVPPIVFEAALSIDKKAFNRHLVPIFIYATIGTLIAAFLTASVVYRGTQLCQGFCESIPYIESLIFGALISSIDPIAVLSVLSNMGINDTDTLYVLVFGESLLNDGVAIVLFQTLEQFLDASVVIDQAAIVTAVIHFFVVAIGSVLVGVGSGIMCTLYYWAMHGCQTPLVEVLMFLCWALLPYYVCDGIGWSGIVAAVTVGFVMDMYVIGVGDNVDDDSEHSHGASEFYEENRKPGRSRARDIFSGEGHLSAEARIHIGFVTEIVATMMETAIFAYLGLFLFSHRYHWNAWHVFLAIVACCLSRAIMIPILSALANWVTSAQKYQNKCRGIHKNSPATGVIIDKKMQMVLWFAGLRGAMSFALVEHIPLFDAVSGQGTRVKAELKAMTSASIMFTVFVLGGLTSYFMEYVGLAPNSGHNKKSANDDMELVSLMKDGSDADQNGTIDTMNGRNMDPSNSKSRKRFRMKRESSER